MNSNITVGKSFTINDFKNIIQKTRKAVDGFEAVVPSDAEKYMKVLYKKICDTSKDLNTAHRMASRIKNITKNKYEKSKSDKINKLIASIKEFKILESFFKDAKFKNSSAIEKMSEKVNKIVGEKDKDHSEWSISKKCVYNSFTDSEYLVKNFLNKIKTCENTFNDALRKESIYTDYMNCFKQNVNKKLGKGNDGNIFDRTVGYLVSTANATLAFNKEKSARLSIRNLKASVKTSLENLSKIKKMYKWVDERASESEVYNKFLKAKKPKGYETVVGSIDQQYNMIKDIYDAVVYGNYKDSNNRRDNITSARNLCVYFMKYVLHAIKSIVSGLGFNFDWTKLEGAFDDVDEVNDVLNELKKEPNSDEQLNDLDREIRNISNNRISDVNQAEAKLVEFNNKMNNISGDIEIYDKCIKQFEREVAKKHSTLAKLRLAFKIMGIVLGIISQVANIIK